jgi:hypothetical protein
MDFAEHSNETLTRGENAYTKPLRSIAREVSMGRRIGFVAAVVLGTVLLGSASMAGAQEKAPAKRSAAIGKDARPDSLVLAKIVAAYRRLFFSPGQDCNADPCNVSITPTIVKVEEQDICIAKIPESLNFNNTNPGNPTKTINWIIAPGGMLVEFHAKNGILLVDDVKQQIKPNNARTDTVTYSAQNKHKQREAATYVPVILYRSAADQAPSVCATGDPQIVNN